MAPKLSSKDMEEVIHAIQAQLTLIQNQLEDTSTKQSTLEAKNDNLIPISHHCWIKSPSSRTLTIKTLHLPLKPVLDHLILTLTSNYPFLKEPNPWTGSFKQSNIFHSIKFLWTSIWPWWDSTCREMVSPGLNGCTTITSSQIGILSQGPWSSVLASNQK